MDIILFTNGNKSILASSDGASFVIDSALIFQDPDLFNERFLYQLRRLLSIKDFSQVGKITFAITGLIDTKNNVIVKTYLLNDISRTKIYDGFDISKTLKKVFDKKQIYLVNDAFATSIGISRSIDNLSLPCLVLTLNDGIGIGIINSTGSILSLEWGGDFVPIINKNIYEAVGRVSLYDMLLKGMVEVNEKYSEYLAESIKYLIAKYQEENEEIKSVAVIGEKTSLIDNSVLKNFLPVYDLHIFGNISEQQEVIIKGCFGYSEYLAKQENRIIKLEYYTEQEKIYDFDDFEKCRKHFLSVKPITNQNNYYKIIYSNGSVKTLTIGNVNHLEELELYRF